MASDSSASTSTSPLVLTPESTGGAFGESPAVQRKSRRQTAFYPNLNSTNRPLKPFSRSAAKRESVMMLGSIEHLQHYFTKTGISAKKNPLNKPHHGLVPAIGGSSYDPSSAPLESVEEYIPLPVKPPSPLPAFPPFVKTYETDPEYLLPGVVDDLIAVSKAWGNRDIMATSEGSKHTEKRPLLTVGPGAQTQVPPFDVLDVLKTTTRTIRSIRNYVFYLPDESAGTIRAQYRSNLSDFARAHGSTNLVSHATQSDPLAMIRRAALEVLTVLRELEEKCRLPLSDDAYDAQSDHGSRGGLSISQATSPAGRSSDLPHDDHGETHFPIGDSQHIDPDASFSFSYVQVNGRFESVPVWEDEEEDVFAQDEEEEKRDHWDDRLVLGSGWLYRQDVHLEDLEKERNVINSYLNVVDDVLFGGTKEGSLERGWERKKKKLEGKAAAGAKGRRVSAGDGDGRRANLDVPEYGRRVSTGIIDSFSSLQISEEPDEMDSIQEGSKEVKGKEEENESLDDEELPIWAHSNAFPGDSLGRAHAILSDYLPPYLLSALPSPTSRSNFLNGLSSGQLLCTAYNSCVRKSKKPWGYVSRDGIHDIIALEKAADKDGEEGPKKTWTFRRTDNLRLWAGALKIRYLLPLVTSPQHVPSLGPSDPRIPVRRSSNTNDFPIPFDAKLVARKDDGWEDMLETVLFKWAQKVVDERRSDH